MWWPSISMNRKFALLGLAWLLLITVPVLRDVCGLLSNASLWSSYILVWITIALNVYMPVACFHLSRLPISIYFSCVEAFITYSVKVIMLLFLPLLRIYRLRRLRNVKRTQEAAMHAALKASLHTEYGRKYKLAEVQTRSDLRRLHPLTTFAQYKPYVDRQQEDRDDRTLVDASLLKFSISSGTTGKPKHLPFYDLSLYKYWFGSIISNVVLNSSGIAANFLAPQVMTVMTFWPIWRWTKSGLPIGPGSVMLTPEPAFFRLFGKQTTPPEAIRVFFEERGKLYVHWLFALRDRNLGIFDGFFGGGFLRCLEYLLANYKPLVKDIREGTLSDDYGIPEMEHYMLRVQLEADPERADEVEREILKGVDSLLPRLFPHLRYMSCLLSAAQKVYWKRIREFTGHLPVFSPFYGGSEAFIGMNSEVESAFKFPKGKDFEYAYTDLISMLEFIPIDKAGEDQPETLFPEQLKAGEYYEIVCTSPGYFRYRIGDVVKCDGFNYTTPRLVLSHRLGNLLDLRGEKTSENVLNMSAEEFATVYQSQLGDLIDFTATESVCLNDALGTQFKQGYVIFMEFSGDRRSLNDAETDLMDGLLIKRNELYRQFRETGFIERVTVVLVKRGCFITLMRSILERNKAISNQFKTPRTFKDEANLSVLWRGRFEED